VILGIGNDLCDIRRVEKILNRFGQRFADRVFTEIEKAKAERHGGQHKAATLAKRFAAKEACAKALGTGFAQGVFLRDIGVVNLPSGQPTLHLTGAAASRLAEMVPPGMAPVIHLTMTDEYPLAEAVVMISARPA
jgi:holo-[acyl-carrier protein] synthase